MALTSKRTAKDFRIAAGGALRVLGSGASVPEALVLPRPADGPYDTGVLRGPRPCVTRCADVELARREALPPGPMR